ncbi:MAG: hypothetical protein LBS26_02730 [Campylobacteraceae bacterium]|nr:hypothetical protein [Campylobacteraceae bacterium]
MRACVANEIGNGISHYYSHDINTFNNFKSQYDKFFEKCEVKRVSLPTPYMNT